MFAEYAAVVLLLLMAVGLAVAMLIMSAFMGKKTYESTKLDSFECGFYSKGTSRLRFSVRFFIVAMLFTLFDIETVFFFPWAVVFKTMPVFAFFEMLVFIIILLVPYIYAWKKGIFEWK